MSKEGEVIKSTTEAFIKGGISSKILIVFGILFVFLFTTFLYVFITYNQQNTKALEEFVRQNRNVENLIETQVQITVFKRCIKKAYDETAEEFENELLMVLGKTLKDYSVPFPQTLNESIRKFRAKFRLIKDCLIFPEELQ